MSVWGVIGASLVEPLPMSVGGSAWWGRAIWHKVMPVGCPNLTSGPELNSQHSAQGICVLHKVCANVSLVFLLQ
jgi:hypothetical protein